MNVEKREDGWAVIDKGVVQGVFGSSEAAWRCVDRLSNEPMSPSEKRSHWIAAKEAQTAGRKKAERKPREARIRDNEAWSWPSDLSPLRDWLAERQVDVSALKSARQVLWMAKTLGKLAVKMPKKRAELYPVLLKIQRQLCGSARAPRSTDIPTEKTRDHRLGTFGPASEVRRIDPSTYRMEGGNR